MSMLMMKKKKNPAVMIVAGLSGEPTSLPSDEEDHDEGMDHIKLAAYQLAEKAGWKIEDMDSFLSMWRMLHQYVHEYEDKEEGMDGLGMDY